MPALCNALAGIPEAPCLTMDIIEPEAPHTTFLRYESHKALHTAQEPSGSRGASGLAPSGCLLWQQGTAQPHHHRHCSELEVGCPLSPCTPGTGHLPQSVLWEAVLRSPELLAGWGTGWCWGFAASSFHSCLCTLSRCASAPLPPPAVEQTGVDFFPLGRARSSCCSSMRSPQQCKQFTGDFVNSRFV